MGAFDLYCLPRPREFDPGWGRLPFLSGGMDPSHSVPRARLCAGHIDGQTIEWVASDSCAEWHHIACVEIESISKWTFKWTANNLNPIDDQGELSCIQCSSTCWVFRFC